MQGEGPSPPQKKIGEDLPTNRRNKSAFLPNQLSTGLDLGCRPRGVTCTKECTTTPSHQVSQNPKNPNKSAEQIGEVSSSSPPIWEGRG